MTTKEKERIENFLKARLKDKTAQRRASDSVETLRRKFGKPTAGFDSLSTLRQLRSARRFTSSTRPLP